MPNNLHTLVSVNAIIVFGDEIILQKVVKKRHALGLPGGKVEGEETFEQALFREIREETGIAPEQYTFRKIAILHEKPQITCKHIYVLTLTEKIEDFIFNSHEISDSYWVKLSEIPTDIDLYRKPWVYSVLRDYIDGRFDAMPLFYDLAG